MTLLAAILLGVVIGALIVLAIMWKAYNEMYSEICKMRSVTHAKRP